MQHELLRDEIAQPNENEFFKKLLSQVQILWPWIIASVILCVSIAYLYLRYNTPEYKVRASLLVKDDKGGGGDANTGILQDLAFLSAKSNVDNEVEILKSRTLMETVVKEQQLFVSYFEPGKVRNQEVVNSPVALKFVDDIADSTRISGKYELHFDNHDSSRFSLMQEGGNSFKGRLGDTIIVQNNRIALNATAFYGYWPKNKSILIETIPFENAVRKYMSRLGVTVISKQASVIDLVLNEVVPIKGERIIDGLISAYLQANINDKNRIADSTISFIDDRLKLVFSELSGIEKDIEGFKINNKLTDISEQSRLLLENTSEYAKQLTTQEVNLSVVEALESFLNSNKNNSRVVPSSLVMQDLTFISLIQRYNEMQLQKDKMLMSLTPGHPSIVTIEEQLKNVRSEILSSIGSIKRGIQVSIAELKKKSFGFESQISKVPSKERIWLDFSRQQAIKQELFLFLLKKREETAISKSSTLANARIIDAAKADSAPFKPQRKNFLVIGFIFGLLLPFAVNFLRNFLNTKIYALNDITNFTKAPILAEIGHNTHDTDIAVSYESKSIIAEQLRTLRTNLNFLFTNSNEKVVLITSSMSGEGKSFLSINLAAALSLAGKKVALLELDLRRPQISAKLNLSKVGFTNLLIDNNSDWKKLMQKPNDVKFEVLSSGPIPPNPAELLMLPRLKEIIDSMREEYDYIIMDSAPIGLVTDAQILSPLTDVTLYVVRHGFTYKNQVHLIDQYYRKGSFPKLNILINDINQKKTGYGYYTYSYGYSYGSNSNY